jgi:hypothetical protein
MKEKYFNMIRAILWLVPIAVLIFFFADYFSIDGSFDFKYEVGKPSGQVSRFYSPDNYQIRKEGDKVFLEINKTPVAFDLKLPTKFEKAKIVLTYKTQGVESFGFGPILDRGKTEFETKTIEASQDWKEQAVEFDLADVYFAKGQGYSFVFETSGGALDVSSIKFDLQKKKLWQLIGEKLK